MTSLIRRGLTYYWRTNLAVVLGVATAVAVLAGALLVGDSVRGSLRALVLDRLGNTGHVVASVGFFREELGASLEREPAFAAAFDGLAPVVVLQGFVTDQESGRRAGPVRVYGVDDRFWRFHGAGGVAGPSDREAFISPSLAEAIGSAEGRFVLVRVQRPTDVPLESLHGRRDDVGRTLRLTVAGVLPAASLGEFSLEPQQAGIRAVFVPLLRLQREIEAEGRVNTLLLPAPAVDGAGATALLEDLLRRHAGSADLGVTIRQLPARGMLVVGADAGLIDDRLADVAREAIAASGLPAQPMLTYLANTMRVGTRETPYSLVTATDLDALAASAGVSLRGPPAEAAPSILLTDWAARDLGAQPGDPLELEYYVWEEPGRLVTRAARFEVAGIVPLAAADRDMAPEYRGISDSATLGAWDPPFPVELRRIRPEDEAFWAEHRTTPKAFVALDVGQDLWRSRYGALTSIRMVVPPERSLEEAHRDLAARLDAAVDPLAAGLAVRDARTTALGASRGATDFGAYFVYFSFFLVVSALLLASLFFKLGVEGRVREVGLLRAVGFDRRAVRRLFLLEGAVLSVAGSTLGVLGAIAYGALMMHGLRTWWVDAVGTTALALHVSPLSLAAGAAGGVAAALGCIWWTLRGLDRISARSLLAGQLASDILASGRPALPAGSPPASESMLVSRGRARFVRLALALLATAVVLLVASALGWVPPAGAFFGAGSALLGAVLSAFQAAFRAAPGGGLDAGGWPPVARLGFRNAAYRPGRSVLSMAVIASATFILIAVDAFRRGEIEAAGPHTGLGGYALIAETLLPVVHDPQTEEGRESLNLFDIDAAVAIEPFRLLPGDDASCLNLYAPRNPRILAPAPGFIAQGRFAFAAARAETDAERENPWLLLQRTEPDGAIPVIADANSMRYVLHRGLGDEIVLERGGAPIRLRLVAALRDSIFQGELLMGPDHFVRLFPEEEGYRVLLVEAPPEQQEELARRIEDALADQGVTVIGTAERLAQFHRVENTYLSTFQTLGGLGLLLGTVGLATVLLRNVLERRRELALLGAVGYRRTHFLLMVLSENALLLAGGLVTGAACAGIAILPAVLERGGRVPLTTGGVLLVVAVFVAGLLSSVVATRAATRTPLLAALRSE